MFIQYRQPIVYILFNICILLLFIRIHNTVFLIIPAQIQQSMHNNIMNSNRFFFLFPKILSLNWIVPCQRTRMVACHRQPVYEKRQTVHERPATAKLPVAPAKDTWRLCRLTRLPDQNCNTGPKCYIPPAQRPFMEKDSIRQVNLAAMRLGRATITHRPGL